MVTIIAVSTFSHSERTRISSRGIKICVFGSWHYIAADYYTRTRLFSLHFIFLDFCSRGFFRLSSQLTILKTRKGLCVKCYYGIEVRESQSGHPRFFSTNFHNSQYLTDLLIDDGTTKIGQFFR